MANKKGRVVNVCVVGLSGYDIDEKRLYGVGKSCFCNRFVRPEQDDYYPEHRSVFSTPEFFGSVINGDQFLYWGSVDQCYDEVTLTTFKVVEQTEFIDDVSNLPLTKGGTLTTYQKRACNTKLVSQGKIKYICRDQVALQDEYDQIQMDRDGKFNVDGFICIYDVSKDLNEHINNSEIQERTLSALLTNIQKTKKPVIVVATKCDESSEETLQKAHAFVSHRKLPTPLVESSSIKNINVSSSFQFLSQLIDTKNRSLRSRISSYSEGVTQKNELQKNIENSYITLLKNAITITKMKLTWNDFKSDNKNNEFFIKYTEMCGSYEAKQVFQQQVKKVKRWYEDRKINEHMKKIPNALDELLPSLQSIESNEWKWEICQKAIKNHILFDKWFEILPNNSAWNKPDRLICDTTIDDRIPFDVLQVERARACFDRHIKKLRESARKLRMKIEFRKLLEITINIRPGTSWLEASSWLCNDESYKYLDETERKTIFETYLRDITMKARLDFQELLFESANKLYKFSELIKDETPKPEALEEIKSYLQNDNRYKNLENVGNARDILLFNHIGLMQHPNRCLSGPENCMDRLMQQVVELTARRNTQNHYENEIFRENEDEVINILVLGKDELAKQLENKIKEQSSSYDCVEYIVDGQIYSLNIRVYDPVENESVEDLHDVIKTFKPQGYLGIYSTLDSLDYVETCVKKIETQDDATKHMSLPLILILAKEGNEPDNAVRSLRHEGQSVAEKMECLYIDYPYSVSLMDDLIHESQVQDAIRGIVDIINKRTSPPTPIADNKTPADVRIMLCAMCGDEFPVELILGTMLQHHTSYSNPDNQDTVMLEAALGGTRKIISVTLGSYHHGAMVVQWVVGSDLFPVGIGGRRRCKAVVSNTLIGVLGLFPYGAYSLKNQLFHGFILVYSATRLASLESLRAFASILPNHVPVQVLEVTGAACSASIVFHEESSMFLVSDDTTLANKLHNKPQSFRNQAGAFLNFFNNVHDRRADTELIQQGIKRRRQDPLPAVPNNVTSPEQQQKRQQQQQQQQKNETLSDEGNYAIIDEGPTSPYVEVAIRSSFFHRESDSVPSSPDQQPLSRSSTLDSHDAENINVPSSQSCDNDLYAKVDKNQKLQHHQIAYIKTVEKASSEDDDDDISWEDNVAYDTSINITPEPSKIISDSPYATVPKKHRNNKPTSPGYDKNNTLPAKFSKSGGSWNEPTYESIEQIKNEVSSSRSNSICSDTSTKKQSQNAPADHHHHKTGIRYKTPESMTTWYVQDEQSNISCHRSISHTNSAPIATPEDDESVLVVELREKLDLSLPHNKKSVPDDLIIRSGGKHRTSSNNSSNSLDPFFQRDGLFKTFINRLSPNPSPVNSDGEHEETLTPVTSRPRKDRKRPSFNKKRKKKDASSSGNDHSLTKPPGKMSLFKFPDKDSSSNANHSMTLPRLPKNKPMVDNAKVAAKDDLFITTRPADNNTSSSMKKPVKGSVFTILKPKHKPRKHVGPGKLGGKNNSKMDDWIKNEKKIVSTYFGRPLKDVSEPDSLCPIFVSKAIRQIEQKYLQQEGIYRVSGNKQDIERFIKEFDSNRYGEFKLGVQVHVITGSLKMFFKMLPEPLIPLDFSTRINEIMVVMDAGERLKQIRELTFKLPPPNLEVFRLFMCHLNKISECKLVNKMDSKNLQIVLYPTLMRPSFENMASSVLNINLGLFVQTCIEQSRIIFEEYYENLVENETLNNDLDFNDDVECFESDSKLIENNDGGADTGYSHDELDNCAPCDEPSFMESVLSDPGMELMRTSSNNSTLMTPTSAISPLLIPTGEIKMATTPKCSYETAIF